MVRLRERRREGEREQESRSERESDNARVRVTGGGTTDTTKGDGERLEIAQDQYLTGSQGIQEPEKPLQQVPRVAPCP